MHGRTLHCHYKIQNYKVNDFAKAPIIIKFDELQEVLNDQAMHNSIDGFLGHSGAVETHSLHTSAFQTTDPVWDSC